MIWGRGPGGVREGGNLLKCRGSGVAARPPLGTRHRRPHLGEGHSDPTVPGCSWARLVSCWVGVGLVQCIFMSQRSLAVLIVFTRPRGAPPPRTPMGSPQIKNRFLEVLVILIRRTHLISLPRPRQFFSAGKRGVGQKSTRFQPFSMKLWSESCRSGQKAGMF